MNEVQKATGDPAVEANWDHAGMFGGGKATIGSLTPGALIWIRVRTCGLKGVMGAWSDPAKIIVVRGLSAGVVLFPPLVFTFP